ncbi:MAG: AMP-binding protein [Bifidobacteriaceae bacterium]|nr:AMP-binding protein [Bifidobacteriaceae bacterium]
MPLPELIRSLERALAGGPAVVAGPPAPELAGATDLPEDTALAVPTSGSTGLPKLVALSSQAIRASAKASADRLGGTGHWLLALPTDHIAGLNVVARALLAGGPPSTLPPGPFTADGFAAACAALPAGPCYTSLVPTQLGRLLVGGPDGIVPGLRRFDAVLVGGAALAPELRQRAEAAGVRIVETYGSAETCGGCVYDGDPLDGVQVALAPGGRVEVAGPTLALGYAGGGEPGQPSQPGGPGFFERHSGPVEVAGPTLTLGHAPGGEPDEPGQPGFFERHGGRWFASSDLGAWTADGRLTILGRADNAITTGGHTISPERVEAVLRAVPGVADALVVGLPEPAWGQVVTALAVPHPDRPPTLEQLRSAVKRELSPAHAPRCLGLVQALPTVAPGKPDRRAGLALAARLEASGQLERLV